MAVSIVLVTYNSQRTIAQCLNSVEENTEVSHEIIVVDNASSDQTKETIKNSGVKARVITQDRNLGFSRANNTGVKQSKGDYIMLLNPDTKLKNNALDLLYRYQTLHPEAGLVVPKLEDMDGTPQKSVRQLPTPWGALKEYYLRLKFSYAPFVPPGLSPVDIESAAGAAMMIKKKLFLRVGGFDKKYFLYFEDLDLCRKILEANLKIKYLPEAVIIHKVGESASSNPNSLKLLKQSSRAYHGFIKSLLLFLLLRFRPHKNY